MLSGSRPAYIGRMPDLRFRLAAAAILACLVLSPAVGQPAETLPGRTKPGIAALDAGGIQAVVEAARELPQLHALIVARDGDALVEEAAEPS